MRNDNINMYNSQSEAEIPWYRIDDTVAVVHNAKNYRDHRNTRDNRKGIRNNNRNNPQHQHQQQQQQQHQQQHQQRRVSKKVPVDFWNHSLIKHLIVCLKVEKDQQEVFKPFNQNVDQIVVDDMGQTVQLKKQLPPHLKALKVSESFIEKCLIYQVDTVYSLWHSILALIYPDYIFLDYERKRISVMRFRDIVNSDFINDGSLREKLRARKLKMAHVQNAISQEKIQDEILLRFLAIYFDINIYLVDDKACYVYHDMQDFQGEPIDALNINQQMVEPYNPYKSSILLYRYPFGNISPVLQENRVSQILTVTTDSEFIIPISSRFLNVNTDPNTVDTVDTVDTGDKVDKVDKVDTGDNDVTPKRILKVVKPIIPKDVVIPVVSIINDLNDPEKEQKSFMNTLLKLKWEDLSVLAEKESINPLKPASKGFNSWKRKTKSELAEEMWENLQNT